MSEFLNIFCIHRGTALSLSLSSGGRRRGQLELDEVPGAVRTEQEPAGEGKVEEKPPDHEGGAAQQKSEQEQDEERREGSQESSPVHPAAAEEDPRRQVHQVPVLAPAVGEMIQTVRDEAVAVAGEEVVGSVLELPSALPQRVVPGRAALLPRCDLRPEVGGARSIRVSREQKRGGNGGGGGRRTYL